jgi:hypothetical protein
MQENQRSRWTIKEKRYLRTIIERMGIEGSKDREKSTKFGRELRGPD